MSDLRILPDLPKRPSPNLYDKYSDAMLEAIADYNCANTQHDEHRKVQALRKVVFSGICMMNCLEDDPATPEHALVRLQLYHIVVDAASLLTPNQVMQVLPVSKTYDGAKWGMKDYFYTIKQLHEHGLDVPMGDKAFSLLYDYMNHRVSSFVAGYMTTIDAVRRFNGEKGMAEEFFGLTPYYEHTDPATGQKYMQNSDTGETFPVKKPIPRYLKPVDGKLH